MPAAAAGRCPGPGCASRSGTRSPPAGRTAAWLSVQPVRPPCPGSSSLPSGFSFRSFDDLATGGFNGRAGTLGHTHAFNGICLGDIAGQHDLGAFDGAVDDVGLLKRSQAHDITLDLRQLRGTHLGSSGADARIEAKLRQTLLQRHLTTLETGADVTALASLLTFVTAGRGFTQAATDTTTNTLLGVFGTGCRAQCIQTHLLAPVDSPGFCRLAPLIRPTRNRPAPSSLRNHH